MIITKYSVIECRNKKYGKTRNKFIINGQFEKNFVCSLLANILFRQIAVWNQISSSRALIGFSGQSIHLAFSKQLQLKVPHSQVLHGVLQSG